MTLLTPESLCSVPGSTEPEWQGITYHTEAANDRDAGKRLVSCVGVVVFGCLSWVVIYQLWKLL